MRDPTGGRSFGLLVAYVLPGFLALVGVAPVFPGITRWLQPVGQADLEMGPPLYAVLAATLMGMVLSCFRWALLDRLHGWFGVRRPTLDDRQLGQVLEGFDYLVVNHFRYYEFCGNSLLAAVGAYVVNRSLGTVTWLGPASDLAMAAIGLVLFAASQSALKNYYARTGTLVGLSITRPSGDTTMYNGNDHGGTVSATAGEAGGTKPADVHSTPVGKPASNTVPPSSNEDSSSADEPKRQ